MRFLLIALVGLLMLCAARSDLAFEHMERRLLFKPRAADAAQLAGLVSRSGIEEVRIKTRDQVVLHGWLKHPTVRQGAERFPLVIVFGGVRRETSWMMDLGTKPERWGWLFVNYRGYGLSEGTPSERAIRSDAELIFDYASSRPDVDPSTIVVLGRSLGSYFTVVLSKSRKVRAAILATPFDSFSALGNTRYPWFPGWLLLHGRYDAVAIAPRIKVPALFIFAERDNVTPMQHGTSLANVWGGAKTIQTLVGAPHYGIERNDQYWRSISEFLDRFDSKRSRVAPSESFGSARQQRAAP